MDSFGQGDRKSGKIMLSEMWKKTWDQWISPLEKVLYTGNYCLCHQLRQSGFDVAAREILLFGYLAALYKLSQPAFKIFATPNCS